MATYHLADQKVAERTGSNADGIVLEVDVPDNVAEGDLIVLRFTSTFVLTSVSGPGDFTLQQSYTQTGTTLSRPHVYVWTKVASASEPANYTVTYDQSASTNGGQRLVAGRVSGHNGVESGTSGGSGANAVNSLTLSGVAVGNNDTLRLTVFATGRRNHSTTPMDGYSFSEPAGVTEHDNRMLEPEAGFRAFALSGGDNVDEGMAPDITAVLAPESSTVIQAGAYITIAPGETGVTLTLPSVL